MKIVTLPNDWRVGDYNILYSELSCMFLYTFNWLISLYDEFQCFILFFVHSFFSAVFSGLY